MGVRNKMLSLNQVLNRVRVMAHTACEMMWIQSLLREKEIVMYITNNLVFHEQVNHIEVDCYFIGNMVM